jgi:hypothetical protein
MPDKTRVYSFKSISGISVAIYSVLSFVIIILSTMLTYLYVSHTIYPGIVFVLVICIAAYIGIKILAGSVEVQVSDNSLIVNGLEYTFLELMSYDFDRNEYMFKYTLRFKEKTITFNVVKNVSGDFLKFTKDLSSIIRSLNNERIPGAEILSKSWYNSRSGKLYGYLMALILLLWAVAMIVKPGNFKWSNFALFLSVSAVFVPMLFRIFNQRRQAQ